VCASGMPRATNAMANNEARQRREQFLQDFAAEQAQRDRHSLSVGWEQKGTSRIQQQNLLRHLDTIQAQHNDTLVERRRRLADLLSGEAAQYATMMGGLSETDAQRRERLIQKAQELRAAREEAKRVDNSARHDRLFREKIDCLRQAESRLKVMQVADERHDQLAAAALRKQQEAEEEVFFTQQSVEAQRLATERAQRDLDLRYKRTERLKGDLAAQVAGNEHRQALERQERQRDAEEFQRLLHEEQTAEAQKRLQRREREVRLAEEMMQLNNELRVARQQEYEALKKEDKAELDAVLSAMAAEEAQQREEKRHRMELEQQHRKDLEAQLSQRKEDTHALDKLWEEEAERQWQKREAQWNADQKKRDNLLRSILIARRQQILDKRQRRQDDAMLRKLEDEQFLASLASEKDVDAEERQRRLQLLKETQAYLEMQIQQRYAEKALAAEARRSELTDEQALEKLHADRIARELANLEAAKPERYKSVPLLPPKSRNQIQF